MSLDEWRALKRLVNDVYSKTFTSLEERDWGPLDMRLLSAQFLELMRRHRRMSYVYSPRDTHMAALYCAVTTA
jgi:hypothetical protein